MNSDTTNTDLAIAISDYSSLVIAFHEEAAVHTEAVIQSACNAAAAAYAAVVAALTAGIDATDLIAAAEILDQDTMAMIEGE